ncbi:MAG TPA: polysaccharide deacetylase family protein [Actinobacteria bacterium]|nr:polysaccharide deacetylase family protein [Actinomycetota bacterium]
MKNSLKYFFPKILYGLALVLMGFLFFKGTTIGEIFIELGRDLETFLIILAAFLLATSFLTSYYEYHGFGSQDGIVRKGQHKPLVCLTFDDGPSLKHTPQVLDILKKKGVKGTFFVTGIYVDKYPEIAKRIVEEGHDIGNHTYNHRGMASGKRTILSELAKTDEAIRRATGARTRLFRPPRGFLGGAARKLLLNEGYKVILWTLSTLDWRRVKPKTILRRVKLFVHNGAIILFHDNGSLFGCKTSKRTGTVKALPQVIDFLKSEGYKMITVSDMLRSLEENEQQDDIVGQSTARA